MSNRAYRRFLRSRSLPIAVACTLAASLGGCATFGTQQGSQVACRDDVPQTKVFASVQRASAQSHDVDDYMPTDDNPEPFASEPNAWVPVTPEPPAENNVIAVLPEPPPPEANIPAAEPEPPLQPELPAAPVPSVEPQAQTPVEPAPAVTVQPQPPAKPQEQTIARVPDPVAPPPPPEPPQEVVEVCGPDDIACQEQLADMLGDPLHKWIKEKPTPEEDRTGVRVLAYRALAPALTCGDLRHGLRETESLVSGIDLGASQLPGAAKPPAGANDKDSEWVQLLGRAVRLELKAEIAKRCS
jgi:hypothetical protein